MGRPKKAAADKRQQITLRFDPAVMKGLKAQADANSKSLGKEIEERVEATIGLDAEGVELVRRISADIIALTRRNKGKRWHADLTAWASVVEMLAEGPIQDMRPNSPVDADEQWEVYEPILEIDHRREELVSRLSDLGVKAAVEGRLQGLLRLNNRDQERAGIDKIPDGDLKDAAIALHTELVQLDAEHEEKSQAFRETMQLYWEAEEAGRQICHDYLYDEAQRARDAGESFNPLHLMRMFRKWR